MTRRDITSDEVGLQIRTFFSIHGLRPEDVEDVVITSVVPQVMYSMKNAFRKYLGKEPLVVQENLEIPIVNRYSNPAEVGADRLVNSFAALRKYGAPLIVVDFGTATTLRCHRPFRRLSGRVHLSRHQSQPGRLGGQHLQVASSGD